MVQSYRQLQPAAAGSGFLSNLQHTTGRLAAWPLLNFVARHAGIVNGYGFFAPQVGSSFALEVDALDSDGRTLQKAEQPYFAHPHSRLRYHSLLNRLQHLLQTGADDMDDILLRQARALTHCLSQRIAKRQWGDRYQQLRCTVSVYQHPDRHYLVYQHVIPDHF